MKFFLIILLLICAPLKAEEGFKKIQIGRGDAYLPTYVMENPKATATIILLPGGDSGTLIDSNSKPTSANFLVRSREFFFRENFNVLIVFRATDMNKLEYEYRVSKEHMDELKYVLNYAKEKFKKPIWLVGTSRGTVSGTAASIALKEQVVHHKMDGCKICDPSEAREINNYLTSSPVKKFIMVEGGSNPTGDYCQALHWHGFINYEQETTKMITDWIKKPQI